MTVPLEQLSDTFKRVKVCLPKKALQEVFTFICFRDGKVSSFDGVSGCVVGCDIGLEFVVKGDLWAKLLGAVKHPELDLVLSEGWLNVRAGSFTSRLPTIPLFDFPQIMPTEDAQLYCNDDNLIAALKIAQVSMSRDEDQPRVLGAGFNGGWLYSVDGKRVTRAVLTSPVPFPLSITASAVNQLVALGQPTYLFTAGNNLCAFYKDQKTVFITRTVAGAFPYAEIDSMFVGGSHGIHLTPELVAAIDRVTVFVDKGESRLTIRSTGNTIVLETQTETGVTRESLPFDAPPFEFNVQAQRLKQTLKRLKPTTVDLRDVLSGQGRMLRFHDPNYQHCLALMV